MYCSIMLYSVLQLGLSHAKYTPKEIMLKKQVIIKDCTAIV